MSATWHMAAEIADAFSWQEPPGPPHLGRYEHFHSWFGRLPDIVISPCCSEFLATRTAIKRLPRAFYEETLRWMDYSAMDDPGWIFEVR